MKKIIMLASVVAIIAGAVLGITGAYFSDTQTSVGNVFAAGTMDLKLNGGDANVVMFTVANANPGESGTGEVALNNGGSMNGYLDIIFSNLIDDDMSCNEPEKIAEGNLDCNGTGAGTGELDANLDILAYLDENDNDAYNAGVDTLVYQGKVAGIIGEKLANYVFNSSASKSFRIDWSVATTVGNEIQSDKTGFDIGFELGQVAGQ